MIIGADISLRHGALVTRSGNILFEYTNGCGMDCGIPELYTRAQELLTYTPRRAKVVIDFDRDSGNWGKPSVAILIAILCSMYGALAQNSGRLVIYATPELIRHCVGLDPYKSKKEVHEHVRPYAPQYPVDKNGDKLDAWLLAYCYSCILQEAV
jgi:hypothetical protein